MYGQVSHFNELDLKRIHIMFGNVFIDHTLYISIETNTAVMRRLSSYKVY